MDIEASRVNPFLQVELKLRPSRRLFYLLSGLHLLALWVVVIYPLALSKLPVGLLLLASLGYQSRCYYLGLLPMRAHTLCLNSQEQWSMTTRDGEQLALELLAYHVVHPDCMVLGFRHDGQRFYLPLLPDSGDSDQLRRLRIRMRFPRA